MKKILPLAVLPLLALGACGGSDSSAPVSSSTTTSPSSEATSTTPSTSEAAAADYPTPPADATPTEPTGLSAALTPAQRDNFMSFRNTMNVVVPKSYGLSDTELLGVAVYVCAQRQMGQPESTVVLAIPGVVQRTAPGQPTWDQQDAKQAVVKAEAVYCSDQLGS